MDLHDGETRALLALMLTPGLGQTLVGRCVEAFGSADAALGGSSQHLGGIKGIASAKAGQLKRKIDQVIRDGTVDRELDAVHAAGVRLVHRDSVSYPKLLRHIPDPPLLLWVRGELRRDDALGLGIVGSRKCSHYGREQADRFAAQCAAAGLCIVSGGAYGIDIAAHRAALRVKGRTIAVIGSGLGVPYPKDHIPVFDQIAPPGSCSPGSPAPGTSSTSAPGNTSGNTSGGDAISSGGGAVVSELPMFVGPKPENFPRRNRIISGMSLGVLVIEAAQRSGALITARLCVEEHGRECMALPGRVDALASAGCHKIIREGWATLVTSVADVLDQLGEAGQLLKVGLDEQRGDAADQPQRGAGPQAAGGGGGTQAMLGAAEASNGGGSGVFGASGVSRGGGSGGGASRGDGSGGGGSLFETMASASQKKIVEALGEARSLDQIVAWTGLAVGAVSADLTMLEIRGAVERQGGLFVRRRRRD